MTNKLFCFGLGFSARLIARELQAEGWKIAGTTRSTDKAQQLKSEGIEPFIFADDQPIADIASALDGVTHVLSSAPPGGQGDPVIHHHGGDLASLPAGTLIEVTSDFTQSPGPTPPLHMRDLRNRN